MESDYSLRARRRFAATFVLSLTLLASASILSKLLPSISSRTDILFVFSDFPWVGMILAIAMTGFLLITLTLILQLINRKLLAPWTLEAIQELQKEETASSEAEAVSDAIEEQFYKKREEESTEKFHDLSAVQKDDLIQKLARVLPSSIGLRQPVSVASLIAIKHLSEKIEYLKRNNPELPFTALEYEYLGDALFLEGRYEEALAYFNEGTALERNRPEIWYSQGITLGRLEKHKEALDSFNNSVVLNPRYERAWIGRAVALYMMKNYEEALQSCDDALNVNPNYFYAWNNKGVMLLSLKRYDESIACFEKALALKPDASAFYNKACVYAITSKANQALESLALAIKLDPSFKDVAKKDLDLVSLFNLTEFEEMTTSSPKDSSEFSSSLTGYLKNNGLTNSVSPY